MKLSIVSDLHLEFKSNLHLENHDNCDVLILAGDIVTANTINLVINHGASANARYNEYVNFMDDVSKKWKHVIVIAGNHEHYQGTWVHSLSVLRNFYSRWSNIVFLENQYVILEGYKFIGATLWTDMDESNPIAMKAAGQCMNDFRIIHNDEQGRSLIPVDTVVRHKESLEYIKQEAIPGCVVITHHLPSYKSVAERFRGPMDALVNHAFFSNLDYFINTSDISLWVHGHTHEECDYMLGSTRVVCNPKGYPHERTVYQPKTIEV